MAKLNRYNNEAINFQLKLAEQISNLLKENEVNINQLLVFVKSFALKKSSNFIDEKNIAVISGEIKIKFDSNFNLDNKNFVFARTENKISEEEVDDEDDALLDEDYIENNGKGVFNKYKRKNKEEEEEDDYEDNL